MLTKSISLNNYLERAKKNSNAIVILLEYPISVMG